MAKFISHILTGASGSVGGTTYSKGRNGSQLPQGALACDICVYQKRDKPLFLTRSVSTN